MSRDIQLSLLGWERACPGICQVESRGAAKHGATTKSFLAPNVKSAGQTGRESDLVFEGVAGDFRQNLRCLWIVFLGSEGAAARRWEEGRSSAIFYFPSQLTVHVFLFTRCLHRFSEKFPFPLLRSRCVNSLFLVTTTALSL